jgi:hypothetical protein
MQDFAHVDLILSLDNLHPEFEAAVAGNKSYCYCYMLTSATVPCLETFIPTPSHPFDDWRPFFKFSASHFTRHFFSFATFFFFHFSQHASNTQHTGRSTAAHSSCVCPVRDPATDLGEQF